MGLVIICGAAVLGLCVIGGAIWWLCCKGKAVTADEKAADEKVTTSSSAEDALARNALAQKQSTGCLIGEDVEMKLVEQVDGEIPLSRV